MNQHLLRLITLLLAAALTAPAQELSTAKPESVGLSSERLERIATNVQRAIDEKRIAGAVTLVARRGHIAWLKAQGMQDREAFEAHAHRRHLPHLLHEQSHH